MDLPGYIPRYGSVDLIDLDAYQYRIVTGEHHGTAVWERLLELERRQVMFDWLSAAVREKGRNEKLFSDLAGAYLYSLEAAVQEFALTYSGGTGSDKWLAKQSEYDEVLRGLRTLRHREAHVATSSVVSGDRRAGHTTLSAGGRDGATVAWHFRAISEEEYAALHRPKLAHDDREAWNHLAESELALDLMQRSTHTLHQMAIRLGGPTRPQNETSRG